MQVGSQAGSSWPSASRDGTRELFSSTTNERLQQAHQLQNTFTAVLAQFGRQGFASAEPVSSTEPTAAATQDSIATSWNEWFDRCGSAAYGDVMKSASADNAAAAAAGTLKQEYGQILVDAYKQGGYAAPLQFVQSLSREQLATVQTIHRLANPIDPYQLKDEGAANLLLPPSAQVDFDGDGLTQVGIGQTIRFPDSSTPREVRDAWEAATANMPASQKMVYELQMKLPLLTANMQRDEQGAMHVHQPGDEQWVNPMASPSYSYREAVDQRLEYLDAFRNQLPPEQWSRDREFWSRFASLLRDASF